MSTKEGPVEETVYKIRLFGLRREQLVCSSFVVEEPDDGISRNIVELGATGVTSGEMGVTMGDDSVTLIEVHTERLERTDGALVALSQKADDSSSEVRDCQPPWENGLLCVDTE